MYGTAHSRLCAPSKCAEHSQPVRVQPPSGFSGAAGTSTWHLASRLVVHSSRRKRWGQWKTTRNLFVTMVLADLWHGANWTFITFGAIHGVVLAVERYFFPAKSKSGGSDLPHRSTGFFSLWAQRILTFNILCLSPAFFRATSLRAAVQLLAGLPNFAWQSEYASAFFMLCIFSIPLFLVDMLLEASNQEYPLATPPYAVRTASN